MNNRRKLLQAGAVAATAQLAGPVRADEVAGTAAGNKEIIRQYFERCWNQGDLDFGRTIIVPDYDLHLNDGPGGYETWRAGVAYFRRTFQDIRFDNLALIAEGDLVAVRSVFTGIHAGEFLGVPPTGKKITIRNADFYRLKNGRMYAHWDVTDVFAILQQIGGLPPQVEKGLPLNMKRALWPVDAK